MRRHGEVAIDRWKFEVGTAVIANSQAPGDWPGKTGVIVERGPRRREYGVRFAGSEVTEYVNLSWMDLFDHRVAAEPNGVGSP